MSPQRVVVVGASCAGKTTFSRALAKKLGAPHVHLDELHWEANWTPASNEKFRERVAQATAGNAWVVDGNYTNKLESLAWKKADTIIWLDPPAAPETIPRSDGRESVSPGAFRIPSVT